MRLQALALAAACGLVGGTAGYLLGRGERPQPAAPEEAKQEEKSVRPPLLRQALTCPPVADRIRDDPEPALPKSTWCDAQLAECQRQRTAVREPWPADSPLEAPDAWQRAIEEAIDLCDVSSADLELMDCKEYPCMAAFRPKPGAEQRDLTEERHRLRSEFRECAPLREALGVQSDEERKKIDVFSLDAQCPDGRREEFMVLSALSPQGPLAQRFDKRDRTKRESKDLSRLHFRRSDDVLGLWTCSD